jgi:lysine 2,3-aminomutase
VENHNWNENFKEDDMQMTIEGEKPPSRFFEKFSQFKNVNLEEWNDWRWQLRNSIRSVEKLSEFIELTENEKIQLKMVTSVYPMFISPYYFSLINPDDPEDPIRKQAIPSIAELVEFNDYDEEDPLHEEIDSPCPGLTHRYPDRVLIVATNFCPTFCRHCTRKRIFKNHGGRRAYLDLSAAVNYLTEHREIKDVVISGGDPLTLPFSVLEKILASIRSIPHIDIIRIGTRTPVTLPQILFDRELLRILEKYGPIWVNTHFNHPAEVTEYSEKAVLNLLKIGIPVNNQSVLLKGVNDTPETMIELSRALLKIRVRPYYIYHCDPVKGVSHFRTSLWKGVEIMERMRGHISGLGVPTYVVDAPGGGGKIPISPNYILSFTEDTVILRNYEGKIFKYHPNGKDSNISSLPFLRQEKGIQIYIRRKGWRKKKE